MYLSTTKFEGSKSKSIFGLPELYYTPSTEKILNIVLDITPTMPEMMEAYFITDGSSHYGYYTGMTSLNNIHGTTQVPATIEIKSNNVSEKTEFSYKNIKYIVYTTPIKVDEHNYAYLELLDVIEEMYDCFEENRVECIKYTVNKLGLAHNDFEKLIDKYSARTREVINNVFAQ